MKLMIVITTPNDDDLHWPRIALALNEYMARVRENNAREFEPDPDPIGRTGGPNRMVASNGVGVFEMRVDREFIRWQFGDHVPTFRRWWGWARCWWLHSRLNPWSEIDLPAEQVAPGTLAFRTKRRYRWG